MIPNKSNVKQNFKRIFMIMFIHNSISQRMLLIMYFLPDVRVVCKTTFLLTNQRLSAWNRRIQKSGNSRWRGKTDCWQLHYGLIKNKHPGQKTPNFCFQFLSIDSINDISKINHENFLIENRSRTKMITCGSWPTSL